MLRLFSYIRVSSEEQASNFSPTFQLEHNQRRAEALGATIVKVFRDLGFSAKDDRRPEFQRMLTELRAGGADGVVVYDLSRFSRSNSVTFRLKDEFDRRGWVLVSSTETFDDSPDGEFMFGFKALEAQYYRKRLARRIQDGKATRAHEGHWLADAPYGYEKKPTGEIRHQRVVYMLETQPFEAEGVVLAFQMAIAGFTALRIAQTLNALGHRTHGKGKRPSRLFSKDTVNDLLHNTFYLGLVKHKKETYPGKHPAIIDQDTFERAQVAIRRRRHDLPATIAHAARIYPLAGILYCRRCEERLQGQANRQVRSYRDRSREKCVTCDQKRYLPAESLETDLAAIIGQITLPSDWQQAILDQLAGQAPARDDDAQHRRIMEQLKREQTLFELQDIDEAEYRSRRAALRAELARLAPTPAHSPDLIVAAEMLKDFKKIYAKANDEERKRLFRFVIERAYTLYAPADTSPRIVAVQPTPAFYPLILSATPDASGEWRTRRDSTLRVPTISFPVTVPSHHSPYSLIITQVPLPSELLVSGGAVHLAA